MRNIFISQKRRVALDRRHTAVSGDESHIQAPSQIDPRLPERNHSRPG
jgi:hypothetical protein